MAARGAPAARAGSRPTGVMVGSGRRGEGASRPLSPPPRNRLLWRPGRRRPALAGTESPAPVSLLVGSPPSRRRTLDAEVTSPGWARREPGRGDESRSQVGGPGRASRAPAPGPSQRLLEVSRSLSTRRRPSRKPLLDSCPPRNKFCGFLGISRRVIGIHKNQFLVSRGLRGESSASADREHSRLLGVLELG